MSDNGQPQVIPANEGILRVDVWPVYVGMGESTDGITLLEYAGHPDYQRGMITWEPDPGGDLIGRARILLPAGLYTHILFCHGPVEMVIGVEQLEHPLVFKTAGIFDLNPIHNRSYLPR